MQKTKSAKKALVLAGIPVIVAAMLVPAFTHNAGLQARADTDRRNARHAIRTS
jgi:hypothetical protein